MSSSVLSKDLITLIKSSGEFFENIRANVQPKIIFIHDEKLPIEEEDRIYRKLPNGLVEKYIVIDRGYHSGIGGMKGHYQVQVRKEGSINEDKLESIINIYSVNGQNARININSTDKSKNYTNDSELLFNELKSALEEIIEEDVKAQSLKILKELSKTAHSPDYLTTYKSFVALLANHMTVIAPFIPALTGLI